MTPTKQGWREVYWIRGQVYDANTNTGLLSKGFIGQHPKVMPILYYHPKSKLLCSALCSWFGASKLQTPRPTPMTAAPRIPTSTQREHFEISNTNTPERAPKTS